MPPKVAYVRPQPGSLGGFSFPAAKFKLDKLQYLWSYPGVTCQPPFETSDCVADVEREIEMLGELAEVALDLAKAVAQFTKGQMAQAAEGYVNYFPSDPSQAFCRLAQTVRRTIALKAHLRQGGETAEDAGRGGDLFAAPPRRGIDLHPAPAAESAGAGSTPQDDSAAAFDGPSKALAADSPAADRAAPRESLKCDLGRLLDDPERFIEQVPKVETRRIVADLCHAVDLVPDRLIWRQGRWFVGQSPRDPVARLHDVPLNIWRPPWPGVATPPYVPPAPL